jgi:hypothetical protein
MHIAAKKVQRRGVDAWCRLKNGPNAYAGAALMADIGKHVHKLQKVVNMFEKMWVDAPVDDEFHQMMKSMEDCRVKHDIIMAWATRLGLAEPPKKKRRNA